MVGREDKNVMRDIEKIKGDLGQLNIEHTPYFKYSTYIHQQNNKKDPVIGELKPKADYTDRILQSDGLMTISQIAKDYGMSGQATN